MKEDLYNPNILLTTVHEGELITEEFRGIPGYEGLYQISSFGRVKSLSKKVKCGGGLRKTKEIIISKKSSSHNRLCANLWKNNKIKRFYVHQLVAMAFLNHTPDGFNLVVDHIDNNPLNNYVENLQLITNRENSTKDIDKKFIGVRATGNKFRSDICLNKSSKQLYLGSFEKEEDAHEVYQKALNYIIENNIKKGEITAKELREAVIQKYVQVQGV